MGQFSAIYYYARSARLREYFDRAARLLRVTSPILFDHSLLNNFASRKKPNMMKSVLCAKQHSTTTGCTTSDVKLASVRVPRVLALSSHEPSTADMDLSRFSKPPRAVRRAERFLVQYWPHNGMTGCTLATGSVSRGISTTPLMRHGDRRLARWSDSQVILTFSRSEILKEGLCAAEGRQLTAEMRHEMDPGGFGGVYQGSCRQSARVL